MTKLVKIGGLLATLALTIGLGACTSESTDKGLEARENKAKNNILCGEAGESLGCKDLREREKRNSDPNRIGYVYLYNFDGSTKGYFVVKGKVSSTQSQMAPMDTIVDPCTSGYCHLVVEAAGDDGTYGPNEDGIFFFLADGTMITYSGEYILTDRPLELQVKKLG
jgi:hypothetical protein